LRASTRPTATTRRTARPRLSRSSAAFRRAERRRARACGRRGGRPGRAERGKKNDKAAKHKFLDSYCINLSQRARDGKLDAGHRPRRGDRARRSNSQPPPEEQPLLIGEPGVGKTAIAEGLAQRIAAGEVPFKLRSKEVYLLDLTALVAGTQFRGQFESRMKGLIEEIRKLGNIILVIDEVHNIVGCRRPARR